jgi:hypothetical protein
VRPFVALDHALFDLHRDLAPLRTFELVVIGALGVIAAAAAFGYGRARAGLPGAVLAGAFAASTPLFVEFCGMSRPYAIAWSLGFVALYFAACGGRRRVMWTGVFFGLAVASRVEMLTLLPVVWWEFWWRRPPEGVRLARALARVTLLSALVAVLVAPWLMTHLIGNLRAIATIRFADAPTAQLGPWRTFVAFGWINAMSVPLAVALGGGALAPKGRRAAAGGLGLFTLLLFATIFRGGFGLHQNGPVFVVVTAAGVTGLGALAARWPRAAWGAAVAGAVLVVAQGAWMVAVAGGGPTHAPADESAAWIERHVPSGQIVYTSNSIRQPLPTAAAADAIWFEAMGPDAWRKKFESGLARFKLSAAAIPRALSEENLVQERGNRRGWFILGGALHAEGVPRYDVRPIWLSPILGVQDPAGAWLATGGVLVWRDAAGGPAPASLGKPVVSWGVGTGRAIHVYCSPDVKLIDVSR